MIDKNKNIKVRMTIIIEEDYKPDNMSKKWCINQECKIHFKIKNIARDATWIRENLKWELLIN